MGLLDDREYFVGVCYPHGGISVNVDKLFTPASNTKIFTSWFALNTLGEDHLFYSEYSVVDSTLYIKPRGNPLLSHADVDSLLEELDVPMGLKEVVVDADFLNPDARPPGWCLDDVGEAYAPVVDDVCFDLNCITVERVDAGIRMIPENTYFHLELDSKTVKPIVRGRRVVLPVERLKNGGRTGFSYPSPRHFFLEYLDEKVVEKGLALKGLKLRVGRIRGDPKPFAEKTMGETLKTLNKQSQNIVAELLLLHAGKKLGAQTRESSIKKMRSTLEYRSIRGVILHDGSGLSRYNLVSPHSVVKVLSQLADSKVFLESLPIGSVDGTLRNRLNERVRAKTGSLLGVRALSGYVDDEPFSIIVNHAVDVDRVVQEIDEFVLTRMLG
ncbi:MAG: D-alanyl-D-alanine carboxypeptidase/D-alanyl-D-alanine-endopeptidase [Thermoprotei archaeon]